MSRVVPWSAMDFITANIDLSPAQRVCWSVIVGEAQPRDFEGEDREIARQLFGPDVEEVPPHILRRIALVKGRNVGGSRISALRLLDSSFALDLSSLAHGQVPIGAIIAPRLKNARTCLEYIVGALESSPKLRKRIVSRTADSVQIRRTTDKRVVSLEMLPASRGGAAARGPSLVGVVFDESAYFRSEGAIINDQEIFRGVMPRLVRGGQALVVSSPWLQEGLLFEMFTQNYNAPHNALAIHAPTRLMRANDPGLLADIDADAELDPEYDGREYRAEFESTGSSSFFDGTAIDAAVSPTLAVPRRSSGGQIAICADAGFKRDASSCVVVERGSNGMLTVLHIDELLPQRNRALVPSEVIGRWAQIAKSYGVYEVSTDQYYAESTKEILAGHGIRLRSVPGGNTGKVSCYEALRLALNEQRLLLPDHSRLLRQLREVTAKPIAGGGTSISSPRRHGSHGDIVSALAPAVHRLTTGRGVAVRSLRVREGSAGADAAYRDRLRRLARNTVSSPLEPSRADSGAKEGQPTRG